MLSHWYNHDNIGNFPQFKSLNKIEEKMKSKNLLDIPSEKEADSQSLNSMSNVTSSGRRGSNMRDPSSSSLRVPWKIVLLGDAEVGKSSLVKRFLKREFNDIYSPTVEDNYMHNIDLPDGISQCIEILDTSGFYQFPAMKELNIKMATAFVLVFDLTLKDSLKNLIELRKIITNIRGTENILIILVGNKIDMVNSTNKSKLSEEAHDLATEKFKCSYVETSAKFDVNVNTIFSKIIELILAESEEVQDQLNLMNRQNSSISLIRRFSLINPNLIEKSRRFSAPNVGQIVLPKVKNKIAKSQSGKTSPNHTSSTCRKKQKNCVLS